VVDIRWLFLPVWLYECPLARRRCYGTNFGGGIYRVLIIHNHIPVHRFFTYTG
jgi:hypothetical protein